MMRQSYLFPAVTLAFLVGMATLVMALVVLLTNNDTSASLPADIPTAPPEIDADPLDRPVRRFFQVDSACMDVIRCFRVDLAGVYRRADAAFGSGRDRLALSWFKDLFSKALKRLDGCDPDVLIVLDGRAETVGRYRQRQAQVVDAFFAWHYPQLMEVDAAALGAFGTTAALPGWGGNCYGPECRG